MRVVFFTRTGFEEDPLFLYIYSHIAPQWPDHAIVAYQPTAKPSRAARWNKVRRLGLWTTLEVLSSAPIASIIQGEFSARTRKLLTDLPRPTADLAKVPTVTVHSINGRDAAAAIKELEPDVLIQAGAGILKQRIFSIPRITTLNLHHGIAPLIKGMNSIHWGLYENRPEWIGSTVHEIDEGIDTGAPLAYAPVDVLPGDEFPELFVRATEQGVAAMLHVIERLANGERWQEPLPVGAQEYRSTISGWKLMATKLRRKRQAPGHKHI
jgi:methionyl-tRNA formyltransferase